ncbi:HlyD family secretion protein [Edaphobacter dinghuensis]|uniref:HlyD family secretion protein n=1 Tax=Edaphobacter dinghuensis TaxID=1560005 RepID=UPI001E2A6FB0|nr:HlyD family secretion protein [Edaphobacter dinghuensis]
MSDQVDQNHDGQTAEINGTGHLKSHNDAGRGGRSGDEESAQPEKSSRRKFIVIAVLIFLVVGAALFYWHSTFTEDTDDAQIDGNLYQVSSRVTGQVIKVYVDDNQKVQQGQLLAEIDPKDYQVALEQAEANLASAQAAAIQANVNVPITSTSVSTNLSTTSSDVQAAQASVAQAQKSEQAAEARVDQAKANALKAKLDVERYTPLVQKDVISKQQYDAAVAQADGTSAAVIEAQSQVIGQQEAVREAQQKLAQARFSANESVKNGPQQVRVQEAKANAALAEVQQAQAKVDQAKLNLSYTHITAPTTGIVNKKNVQVGANLSIGQDLLTIIPLTDLWVTANFKETQIQHMHPGQDVTIEVDALGGRKFHGKVTQIGGATGSRLSLFPPENATGNYVKVVQRIPVRIDFNDLQKENGDYALRPGFSVTPYVSVK